MTDRVGRLRASLQEPLLVTNPVSVRYLTGFVSSSSALLVDEDRVTLYTDFRYAEGARAVEGVEFVQTERAIYKELAGRLSGRIGFEADYVTYGQHATLAQGEVELVPRYGLVETLRRVKDEAELEAIRAASEITNRAYERLAQEAFVGRTERERAWRIGELFHELGGSGPAYDPIVASGDNGARPHTVPGERRIGPGELVVIDAAAALDGYCSDCTRTFATGPLQPKLKEAYEVCRGAQQAALGAIRAGIGGPEADSAARDPITEAGFGDAFGHGLGHGVGMLIHEAPRLAQTSEDILEPGNVVTVEPGIYLSGLGGVRIEDLVVVTDDGSEVLTTFTKELVTVD